MIFSLAIYSPPSSGISLNALRFAEALARSTHTLDTVFFYHDGAYHGLSSAHSPQGEFDLSSAWQELKRQYGFNLSVCIAAGIRRGVLDKSESERYQKNAPTLLDDFKLTGLSQLAEMSVTSDRVVTFGGPL